MERSRRTPSGRDLWLATAALLALTTLAAWIPLAGGQSVEPLALALWWALAALSLASVIGLVARSGWAVPALRLTAGIWLVLSGVTLVGVTRAFAFPKAGGVAATIGWAAMAAFAAAATALWFGLRAQRAR